MEMQVILNQMAVLFILMALGFVLGKSKVLTPDGNKLVTKIILFVTLPATIISSVLQAELEITIGATLYFLLMSFLTLLLAYLISYPFIRIMGGYKANRGLYSFMSVFSNSAFMGIPVIIAVFGIAAAFYAALFNIVFNILVFSFGIIMISGKGSKFNPKLLLNPTLLISLLAIPIALTDVAFPFPVSEAIRITGAMTTPGAMLIIGSILAYIPIKTVLTEWRVFPVTLLRLVVVPIVTWVILRQIITDEFMLSVLILLTAMPTAVLASMMAIEYDGNEEIASAGVFLTTLLCGITVPALIYFLLM